MPFLMLKAGKMTREITNVVYENYGWLLISFVISLTLVFLHLYIYIY